MFKNKSRWKNYGLWLAVFSFIPMLLDGLKIYNINVVIPGNYEILINALLGIFVMAGILNDPNTEDSHWFKDDNQNGIPDDQE